MVQVLGEDVFAVSASDPHVLDQPPDAPPLAVDGFARLYATLRIAAAYARTRPNRVAEEFARRIAMLPQSTQAERLIVQRVGQNLFRDALLDYWQSRCCITGLDVPQLLRASHIRPWAQCGSDQQRLDVFNGLLLAPHLDALFDGGWMTIDEHGRILLCGDITPGRALQLGLPENMTVAGLRDDHQRYLAHHRTQVWRG